MKGEPDVEEEKIFKLEAIRDNTKAAMEALIGIQEARKDPEIMEADKKIFNDNKKNHRWNCYNSTVIKESYEPITEEIPGIIILDKTVAVRYDWNCETSLRLKLHKDMEEFDYVLIYE